jgi:A/G-specific adenine glycosylase
VLIDTGERLIKEAITTETKKSAIAVRLLRWFASNRRSLPWREGHSAYETWISEIMLQQTQVKTMLPYYARWMRRFPDVLSIAETSEDELLKYWEGLGYYARARNICKTAQILMREFAGRFPEDHGEILALPGIGAYTAGAIMSLAYNRPFPAVDGNTERVFARLFNLQTPVKDKANQTFIWKMAREIIPEGQSRSFNQALMELGALVCLPQKPRCFQCPLARLCDSRRLGVVEQRPVAGERKKIVHRDAALGVLVKDGRIFIQKRPESGLMAGLWEFPGGKLEPGEDPMTALQREFHEELGLSIDAIKEVAVIKHSYTTFRITLYCYLCRLRDETLRPVLRAAVASRWVKPAELDRYAFPAANGRLLKILRHNEFFASAD